MTIDKPSGPCCVCQKRPATSWWAAEGGILAHIHGMSEARCELCCVEEQLKFAEEAAGRVESLRRKRQALLDADNGVA